MIDIYNHVGKDDFLRLLKEVPPEDLRDGCSEIFPLVVNALLAKDSLHILDIDLVIFNNFLQRKDAQDYLAKEYVWDSAKLFCLPFDCFNFFMQIFFADALSATAHDYFDTKFRSDLINNQMGLLADKKEWQSHVQEKLMRSIFLLENKEIQAQVLAKILEPRGSLNSFLGTSKFRPEIEAQLAILEGRAPMVEGSFAVYTSSFWDPSYRAEAAAKKAAQDAIYDAL
jgi:hypothetical protein